jgi:hypothetical protein
LRKILFRGMAGASAVGGVDFNAWFVHRFRHVALLMARGHHRFTCGSGADFIQPVDNALADPRHQRPIDVHADMIEEHSTDVLMYAKFSLF